MDKKQCHGDADVETAVLKLLDANESAESLARPSPYACAYRSATALKLRTLKSRSQKKRRRVVLGEKNKAGIAPALILDAIG
jgi:hypothetical protein